MAINTINNFLFESTALERTNRLLKVVEQTVSEQRVKKLPLVYRNEMCTEPNEFVHEYPDGRKFLIRQDQNTSEESIIKQF